MSRQVREVRVHSISVPLERAFWMSLEPYTTASEIVVEVETDDGLTGIGEIHGRPQADIVKLLEERLIPRVVGRDADAHETLWEELFALSTSRAASTLTQGVGQPHFGDGGRPQLMAAIAGIDIALWDIKAQAAGLPLYRLLGGAHGRVDTYASGGYYGPNGEAAIDLLVAEMQSYAALGYRAMKMKVGGLDLPTDIARVAAVRDVLPDVAIMLDANSAYDVPRAVAAARAFEPFDIAWLEEPIAWYDPVFGLGRLAASTRIPLASGESEIHRWGCRDLIDHSGISVMQFDCTRAGGISEWLKVASYAAAHGVLMAPHHDPQVHGHLLAAVSNGHVQEIFPDESRDPLWAELFVEQPEIVDGSLVLSERPGLGITLNREFADRYSTAATQL